LGHGTYYKGIGGYARKIKNTYYVILSGLGFKTKKIFLENEGFQKGNKKKAEKSGHLVL